MVARVYSSIVEWPPPPPPPGSGYFAFELFMSSTVFCSPGVSAEPVTTQPTAVLLEGITGTLPCLVEIEPYAVFWSKGPTHSTAERLVAIDQYDKVGERSGEGYELGLFNITNDFSLVIYEVKAQDEGRYYCEVSDVKTGTRFRDHTDVTVSCKYACQV